MNIAMSLAGRDKDGSSDPGSGAFREPPTIIIPCYNYIASCVLAKIFYLENGGPYTSLVQEKGGKGRVLSCFVIF